MPDYQKNKSAFNSPIFFELTNSDDDQVEELTLLQESTEMNRGHDGNQVQDKVGVIPPWRRIHQEDLNILIRSIMRQIKFMLIQICAN